MLLDKVAEIWMCLKLIKADINMDELSDRVKLQHHIYLMQLFGVDLGFRFGWHIIGPYSSELNTAGHMLSEQDVDNFDFIDVDVYIKRRISLYYNFYTSATLSNITEADKLMLLASVHYLKHIAYLKGNKNKEGITNELMNRCKWFSKRQIHQAWAALERVGLINSINVYQQYFEKPGIKVMVKHVFDQKRKKSLGIYREVEKMTKEKQVECLPRRGILNMDIELGKMLPGKMLKVKRKADCRHESNLGNDCQA